MKKCIELDNPIVRLMRSIAEDRAMAAAAAVERVEMAIRPIFLYMGKKKYLEQIGSCVILRIEEHLFALSASHVFDEIDANAVLVACGDRVHQLVGDRYSSLRGPSGSHKDDPIDASVLHLAEPIPDDFHKVCLTLDDLDLAQRKITGDFHVIVGYRAAASGRRGAANMCVLDKYATIEHSEQAYVTSSTNYEHSVSIAYEDEVLVGDLWQASPSLKGMSGGAIFRIEGIPGSPHIRVDLNPVPKLTAITVERARKTASAPAGVLGTRIGFHLGLIEKYNPGLVTRNAQ